MRGVLLDPRTGKPEGHASVPPSGEVTEWQERVAREQFDRRTRDLLSRSDKFKATTTTNRYLCYPAAAAGVSLATSGSTAWSNPASYTQVMAAAAGTGTNVTFYIAAVVFQPPAASALATTNEFEIDIATGASGSEVVIMTIPFTVRNVTAAGYIPPAWVDLPEPKQITASSRIAARVRYSVATTVATVTGFKFVYETP